MEEVHMLMMIEGLACPVDVLFNNRISNHYDVLHYNSTSVILKCMLNHHQISGKTVIHCLNNKTWDGKTLLCAVDKYKDSLTLSLVIVFTCMLISLLFFGIDFYCFIKKRLKIRRERALYRDYIRRREHQYHTGRCQAFPNLGLSIVPEINERNTANDAIRDNYEDYDGFSLSVPSRHQYTVEPKKHNTPFSSKFSRGLIMFRMQSRPYTEPLDDPMDY
ncbi:uncharacterized protein LOC131927723 isoform X2 [Physella acuta]|uniref:uncharacterized protein LOC131927723 isoform X2 n=1 Tax=Physella acuta TaxID=109671 RepID=UPI0027DB73BE|nr:uncharacterized protein LOC131927723 isoform X2 [Physella acuta]